MEVKYIIYLKCIYRLFVLFSFIGQTHNLEAARVSMPGQIRKYEFRKHLILKQNFY